MKEHLYTTDPVDWFDHVEPSERTSEKIIFRIKETKITYAKKDYRLICPTSTIIGTMNWKNQLKLFKPLLLVKLCDQTQMKLSSFLDSYNHIDSINLIDAVR